MNKNIQINFSSFFSPTTFVFILILFFVISTSLGVSSAFEILTRFICFDILVILYALNSTLEKPQILIRKYKMLPLENVNYEVNKYINTLIQTHNIKSHIECYFIEGLEIQEPFTFGTFVFGYIAIPSGYLDLYINNRNEFNSIIYHELAHLEYGDI